MAAGEASVFFAMVNVRGLLVPQLFAVTLKTPLAVKFGVNVILIVAVPCPLVMFPPAGAVQL